jgi:hypothetical protein
VGVLETTTLGFADRARLDLQTDASLFLGERQYVARTYLKLQKS